MEHKTVPLATAFIGQCLQEEGTPSELRTCELEFQSLAQLDAVRWRLQFQLTRDGQSRARAECLLDLTDFESLTKHTCRIVWLADEARTWDYGYTFEAGQRVLRSQISLYRRNRYRLEVVAALRRLCFVAGQSDNSVIERELIKLGYSCSKTGLEQYLLATFNRPFRISKAGQVWELWPTEPHPLYSACKLPQKLADWLDWTELVSDIEAA